MDRAELLELIDRAAEEGWKKLDLSGQGLTELPPEIGKLTQLKVLKLRKWNRKDETDEGNSLSKLPEEIGQLENLEALYLSGNRLTELPESISSLTKLKAIFIEDNNFRKIPEAVSHLRYLRTFRFDDNRCEEIPEWISQLDQLWWLGCNNNNLNHLPDCLGNLTNLRGLFLRKNPLNQLSESLAKLVNLKTLGIGGLQLSELPQWISQLPCLRELYIGENPLSDLPEWLIVLDDLRVLDIQGLKLTAIPKWIGQLTKLRKLDVSNNQLTNIPESLSQLTRLHRLDLDTNQLTEVPEWLGQLVELKELYLSSNQLTTVPDALAQLTKLEILSLWGNQLTEVPEWLGQLVELKELLLSSNQLTTVPDALAQLTKLEKLFLSANQLTEVPEWLGQLVELKELSLHTNQFIELPNCIGKLTNLKILDLDGLSLSEIPQCLANLSELEELDLRKNRLTNLPEWLPQLKKLKKLNLSSNLLNKLPATAQALKQLDALNLQGNPLPIPPEILDSKATKKPEEILDFYFSAQQDPVSAKLFEAKMLVVGEGGAGKTSLAKKIQDEKYELKEAEKSTEGIDVIRWKFDQPDNDSFRLNMWDFGGQEIYHATHQFFLTKRSLYVLVADTRKVDTDFYYWLKVIELLSDNSPVIIVKNERQDRQCEINERQMRGQFTNLQKILSTNLSDNRGLSDIKEAIKKQVIDLPHVGTVLPGIWVKVRSALENYSKNANRNHITVEEYCELCKIQGFTDRQQMLNLSGYLHDLGVCLHFQDDKLLKKTVILNPEWGTTAAYKVFDNKQVQANQGQFTDADLMEIWSEEKYIDMRDELLQLMMKFKLCYEIPNAKGTYIAPSLLSISQPKYDWDENENIILRFKYEFMPKGILTRFIVEMHKKIEDSLVWKNGVIITDAMARAEIIEYYHQGEIRLRVSGKSKKALFTVVVHELEKIHDSYERLGYKAFIPCNCTNCHGSQHPYDYAFKTLIQFLNDGQTTIQCQKSYQMVNVRRLIDDVTNPPPQQSVGYETSRIRPGRQERPERRDYNNDEGLFQDPFNDMLATQPMMGKVPMPMIDAVHAPAQAINLFFPFNISQEASMGNTYNQYGTGDNIIGDNVHGDKIGTQIINNQDLAQAAQDIKALLDELSEEYNPNSSKGQSKIKDEALAQIQQDTTLKSRAVKALKASSVEAFNQAIDHPVAKIVIEGIKAFTED
ncbi:leucine-rich repeat protein [Leptothoe sp. PORK10 BA2]|uniref:leucine-rich repeat protein n=1 Tax=Leptothoe sp. PORK10 BA2 TaxID=3110254 RepID=UPI002B21EDFC|nr:leucine-rich repeat protein [Leptothoe sp. PORK10 BA2]MEA5466284.1 leucine-rich repeat protein [Leptothoe sp. PORK10 BA2]